MLKKAHLVPVPACYALSKPDGDQVGFFNFGYSIFLFQPFPLSHAGSHCPTVGFFFRGGIVFAMESLLPDTGQTWGLLFRPALSHFQSAVLLEFESRPTSAPGVDFQSCGNLPHSIAPIILQIAEQISLIHAILQHLFKAILYCYNILMVGHSVPGIVGF